MERIPTSPPKIAALPLSEVRPIWSVMIPVYNCAEFIPSALESVLEQDLGETCMQIEVVDDASSDADIADLVLRLGKGRVKYFRQTENVGSLRNFETCINRAKGEFVHLLHGDDRVKPGFYQKINQLFQEFPEAGAAFCNYSFINGEDKVSRNFHLKEKRDGILSNWLVRIAEFQKIQYVSMVIRREVYEKIGAFYGTNYGEDWEMWVRIAKHYPVAYTPEVLAEYRGHLGSITWEKCVSGEILQDMLTTIHHIQAHLPIDERSRVMSRSKKHCANYLIGRAISLWNTTKDLAYSHKLIRDSLKLSKDFYPLLRIAKFYINVGVYKVTGKSLLR